MNYVYCLFGDEHANYAARSAETIKRQDPDAKLVFYVDRPYEQLQSTGGRQMPYPEAFQHPFMIGNVLCQLDWLLNQEPHPDEFTVYVDTDVLHAKPIDRAYLDAKNADIYPTFRTDLGKLSDHMPYNYGVLIVRHTVAAKHAMSWLLQRVMKLQPARQHWYGNQIALRELVGPIRPFDVYDRPMGYFTVRVHQLPCREWNWSPNPKCVRNSTGETKYFVHLKGSLKDNHFDYFYDKVINREAL